MSSVYGVLFMFLKQSRVAAHRNGSCTVYIDTEFSQLNSSSCKGKDFLVSLFKVLTNLGLSF